MGRLISMVILFGGVFTAAGEEIVFNRDIRPILSENCFHCHGPDKNTREAGLRLDKGKAAHKEAIVAGDLEESEMWYRITTDDEADVMPPPDSERSLTKAEVDLLKRWIEQGAEYQEHWSFIVPERAEVPAGTGAIDHFVRKGVKEQGLSPKERAERSLLLRRVFLDLTGIPPTPEEIEVFLADDSSEAWERVVDSLLASPRYGEHMARYWLDAVRYGDTHGLHLDNYREFYPYRDWVIAAFNKNKSWHDFLTEQLAGDLLENPTDEQLVATGFNRAHVTTAEGGSIKEEVYVRNVTDRVATFGTVMLGLTAECAACHDHKFDPISQREFYQFFAYFNNLDADPMDGNKKDHAPVIRIADGDGKKRLAEAEGELGVKRKALAAAVAAYEYEEPESRGDPEPVEQVWVDDEAPAGATAREQWNWVESVEGKAVFSGRRAMKREGPAMTQHFVENAKEPLVVGKDAVLFAEVFLGSPAPKQIMLQFNTNGWKHRAYWGENKIGWGKDGSTERHRMGDLPEAGRWVHLEVPVAVVGLKAGDKITGWAFTQFEGVSYWDRAGMRSTPSGYQSFEKWLADMRAAKKPGLPGGLDAVVKQKGKLIPSGDLEKLRRHYIEHVDVGAQAKFSPLKTAVKEAEGRVASIKKSFPTSLIWKERAKLKQAYILDRGEYDRKGEEVERALPKFLPEFPEGAPNDRLGLAQWLLAPEHPLTARVAVNRFWQQLFGVGLVKTAEDFGSQGEWPSHPELLDWLAVEFRESGWDVKHLMKLMVMSETYQQSSVASSVEYQGDPENRYLARGPRFRLDAETLRDQALAVSGLLVEKVGGPGVKPPQPDGLWYTVGYSGSNTVRFKPDTGPEKVHRRSLYTFWKRTSPPPQMVDAPSRESCVVRRERTNTPLQALMFMNDPQFVEAARAFAERFEGSADEEIPGLLYSHALARSPDKEELALLRDSYREHLAHFEGKVEEAKALVGIGDSPSATENPARLAAWTMVASLVMNLDEFVTKN